MNEIYYEAISKFINFKYFLLFFNLFNVVWNAYLVSLEVTQSREISQLHEEKNTFAQQR